MFSSPQEADTGLEARFTLLCFHYRNVPHKAMAEKTTPLGSAMHMDVHFQIPMKLPINPTHMPNLNQPHGMTTAAEFIVIDVSYYEQYRFICFSALSCIFLIILYACIVK